MQFQKMNLLFKGLLFFIMNKDYFEQIKLIVIFINPIESKARFDIIFNDEIRNNFKDIRCILMYILCIETSESGTD